MKRRDALAALGGLVGTAGLAGCLGSPGGSNPSDTPAETPVPQPSDSGPHPVTPADRTFAVLSRECGQGRNEATVAVDGDTVTVEGTIGGRDTCDTAVLRGLELHDGTLTATVAAEPIQTTETPVCGQCLTDVRYRLTVDLGNAPLDRVVVVHHSGGERLTVADERATE